MKTNVDNPTSPLASEITTQTDVTVSRAIDGTVYHNTTAKPIFVVVTLNGSNQTAQFYTDSNAAPVTSVAHIQPNAVSGGVFTVSFIVLSGNYYKGVGNLSIVTWIEYQ